MNRATMVLFVAMLSSVLTSSAALSLIADSVTIGTNGSIVTAGARPLHTVGNQILDDNGNRVVLRGVDYTYFMDTPSGSWMGADGYTHWDSWRTNDIGEFLGGMASWKVNTIRVFGTVEFWTRNLLDYQSKISYFVSQAALRGIYVLFTFWRVSQNGQDGYAIGLPYPPYATYASDVAVIDSTQTFVNLWADIASKLKGYNNVLFEFWNEPNDNGSGGAETSWFNVTQQCIHAVRAAGATQLIDITWDGPITYDFATGYVQNWDWVSAHPLNDPLGNLLYDMHIYRDNAYDIGGVYDNLAHTFQEVTAWLNVTDTLSLSSSKPLMVGEIGFYYWRQNQTEEAEWYNNTLTILDQYKIGYCAFAGPPWSTGSTSNTWALIYNGQPNYTPNIAGQILIQHLANPISP
jgi:hypothetical protein